MLYPNKRLQGLGTVYISDDDDDIIIMTSDSDFDAELDHFETTLGKGKQKAGHGKRTKPCLESPCHKKTKF